MPDPAVVAVVGGGLGGLAAACAATEAGADVVVLEACDAPGGATAESAGWVWRYGDVATAQRLAPHGRRDVQAAVVHELDPAITWLVAHGVRLVAEGTGRTFTCGARVDPAQLIDALVRQLPDAAVRTATRVTGASLRADGRVVLDLSRPAGATITADAVVFAGGGYAADVARVATEAGVGTDVAARWRVRPTTAGDGSSLDALLALGASRSRADGECFARLVPLLDRSGGDDAVPRSQLIGVGELLVPGARLRTRAGAELDRAGHDWSGTQLLWRFGVESGDGELLLPPASLDGSVHAGPVRDVVAAAEAAGVDVRRSPDGAAVLPVACGLTHTICGVDVAPDGRVRWSSGRGTATTDGAPPPRVFAAGCDALGTGAGGTASGLAHALVLGRAAGAEAAR